MKDLEYSPKAFAARSLFYSTPVVYVEGIDDIPFWSYLFEKIGFKCTIEALGGVEEVLRHLPIIESDISSTNFAAIDGDYKKYNNTIPSSTHIFVTPTYGIENLMFCPTKMSRVLFSHIKKNSPEYYLNLINDFLNEFKEKFIYLTSLDILNYVQKTGQKILESSFAKFFNKSTLFDDKKISIHEQMCMSYFSQEELIQLADIKSKLHDNFFDDIKCHFLESFYQHMLREIIRKSNANLDISNDALRDMCYNCLCTDPCKPIKGLYEQIKDKLMSLNIGIEHD